jgi:hypothetical protein
VHIYTRDFHGYHVVDSSRNFGLQLAAYLAYFEIARQLYVKIYSHAILFHLDADALARTPPEKPVDAAREIGQTHNARHSESSQSGDGHQYSRGNGGGAGGSFRQAFLFIHFPSLLVHAYAAING